MDRLLVAAVVIADLVAQLVVRLGGDAVSPPLSPLAGLVAVASALPLLKRRDAPLATLLGLGGAAALAAGWVPPGLLTQQTGVTVILGMYAIGSWSRRRWASVLVPGSIMVLLFLGAYGEAPDLVQAGTVALAAVALPWMAGRAARSRRQYVEEVERRLAAAETERDERARRAVLDERRHIARELHDVVAHHVSLIGVQAGAARMALDDDPATTRAALRAIEDASRTAVGEMRTLLGVLRDDDERLGLCPQPGLADLGDLVEDFRGAGLDVVLTAPPAVDLMPALGLTGYRVVEEALTNVTRHSRAAAATVSVEVDPDEVRLVVIDPGPRREPAREGGGRGLVGLRERVALFGGRQQVGPTPEGGFAVRVCLPREER